MEGLTAHDATGLADLVRRKQVKPIELVDAAIERIERLNPTLNAVVTPMYDEARETSSGPLTDGPFAGVPFLLKDLGAQYGGVRYTEGSQFLADYVSPDDTELVVRHRRAGLIVIGKTNTPEFGLMPTTEPRLFGPTRNPWDTARTPGGSSGGSAAAVAAGIVPMAHGNDGGGSIRIPASCCGLFGLKPTRARNTLAPYYGDQMSGLVCEHALSRTVRDSAALLDATSGPAPGDPYAAPAPRRPYLEEIGADPGRLRIAFAVESPTGTPVDADCAAAVKDAAALCEELGHEVVEASPAIDGEGLMRQFTTIFSAATTWTLDDWARKSGRALVSEQFEPMTWALYEMGRQQSASSYMMAVQDMQRMSRDVARFLLGYDLWLTPTLGEPPPPLGVLGGTDDAERGFNRLAAFIPFTPIGNATGQPAMSVPLYWNSEGLPIGTHFVGRFGDEGTLFRLAGQLEQARPWTNRRPPVFAEEVKA